LSGLFFSCSGCLWACVWCGVEVSRRLCLRKDLPRATSTWSIKQDKNKPFGTLSPAPGPQQRRHIMRKACITRVVCLVWGGKRKRGRGKTSGSAALGLWSAAPKLSVLTSSAESETTSPPQTAANTTIRARPASREKSVSVNASVFDGLWCFLAVLILFREKEADRNYPTISLATLWMITGRLP